MVAILAVKATEGVFWHTVISRFVKVTVPVDLHSHYSTLHSANKQKGAHRENVSEGVA